MLIQQLHILQAFAPSDPAQRERFLNGRAQLLARTRRARLELPSRDDTDANKGNAFVTLPDETGTGSDGRPFPRIRAGSSLSDLASLNASSRSANSPSRRGPTKPFRASTAIASTAIASTAIASSPLASMTVGQHRFRTSVGVSTAALLKPGLRRVSHLATPRTQERRSPGATSYIPPGRVDPYPSGGSPTLGQQTRDTHRVQLHEQSQERFQEGAGSLETGLWVLGALALALLL